MNRLLAPAALAALLLAGCPSGSSRPRTPAGDCVPGATGPRAYDALAYDLRATYDWTRAVLEVSEGVTLAICPGGSSTVTLDAASTVTVTSVQALGDALPFDRVAGELHVSLATLGPGTSPVTFTIEYEAAASDAMMGTTSAWSDDPVQSRIVLTDSEPDRARQWLVSKDDPSDRALFSAEVSVPAGEDVISNGERLSDVSSSGVRTVRYALGVPLPTYLMAFAAGELDHAERTLPARPDRGALPIGLWWRRGLAVDPTDNLDAVEQAMATFEDLLGPYPFPRYSVVLVPNGGGMENASITFDYEWSGQGPASFGLNAHELAHHWFGDWVTMRTYEDVWFKEGMATLLASEAERPFREELGGVRPAGDPERRLFAGDFTFDPADAIVDTSLTGLAKYTTGPYGRAAALMTQIRAKVGDEAFWRHCREFLAAHALGSATGEDYLRAFSPELDEAAILHLLDLLPQTAVPSFTGASGTVGTDLHATYVLDDPDRILVARPDVERVSAGGTLVADLASGSADLVVPPGAYVVADAHEVHWERPLVTPYLPDAPDGPEAATLLQASTAHQEDVASYWTAKLAPDVLPGFLADLDSTWARAQALGGACASYPDTTPASVLDPPPERWPLSGRLAYRSFLSCSSAGAAFEAELVERASRLDLSDLKRLEYLLSFHYGPTGRAAIANVLAQAPSRRLRYYADLRLSSWDTTGLRAPVPAGPVGRGGRLDARDEEAKGSRPSAIAR